MNGKTVGGNMPVTYYNSVVLLALLISGVASQDDTLISDLPAEMIQELQQIITNTLTLIEPCGAPTISTSDVRFLLYTRSNPNIPIILNASNPVEVDAAKRTVLISHGWTASPNVSYFPDLKNGYLQRYDCNVIMVDWAPIAAQLYTAVYCDLRGVAEIVGKFLCLLSVSFNVDLSTTVHLVGHSLGAHLSGFAGNYTQDHCAAIVGRITGLDPAGPLYQGLSKDDRLDPSDAKFVDIYHSNERLAGYDGPCGHVDFYLNGGMLQPGCELITLDNLLLSTVGIVSCSHMRVLIVYAESINSIPPNIFIAISCTYHLEECFVDLHPRFVIAGEDCLVTTTGNYELPTNGLPPYARGCAPYPFSQCSV